MAKLPTDPSGRDLVKALLRIGFVQQRQRGSHILLLRQSPHTRVTVPDHKGLRLGTLRSILHEANPTVAQLLELLLNSKSPSSYVRRATIMVMSSRCSRGLWARTSLTTASSKAAGGSSRFRCSVATRRSSPNSSSASLKASVMPSV
jgi:predicted RNA binding protein YcfA (HicA-like mRNA interferase family)